MIKRTFDPGFWIELHQKDFTGRDGRAAARRAAAQHRRGAEKMANFEIAR